MGKTAFILQVKGRWSEVLEGSSSITWQDGTDESKWDGQRMWSIVDIELWADLVSVGCTGRTEVQVSR